MSRQNIIYFMFIILICVSTSKATLQFEVSPEFGIMGGTTEYEMDIKYNFIDTTGTTPIPARWHLTSLLEFPLDFKLGGISADIYTSQRPNTWKLHLKYLTNITNPKGSMIDSDWEEISNQFAYTKFSETNSGTEIDLTYLEAEFQFLLFQKKKLDVSLFLSGSYQKLYNDIKGLEGWQRPFDSVANIYGDQFYFDLYQDSLVGTYEQQIKQVKIGVLNDISLSNQISSQIKFGFTSIFYNDIDDHVLRYKLSTSKGDGKGINSGVSLKYETRNSLLSFFKINFLYNHYTATGPQTQTWYDDDPGTPEDDTGDSFTGLPHKIRTTQYMLSAQIGFTF